LLPLARFSITGGYSEKKYFKKSSGIVGTLLLLIATILALYTAYGYYF
jgi:hypothetical protein